MAGTGARTDSFEITREGVIFLLLLVLVLVSYGRVTGLGFVDYDDPEYVTDNPQVLEGISPGGLVWAARALVAGNWQPVDLVSHQLDATLYGDSPYGHHLTNLLLHLANVALLFWVLRSMTGSAWRSALVAALFAVHPMHVQSVAWVSARKDVLSTLFWLLTLLAYARYVRKPGRGRFALALVLFALGLMTKSMLVTVPCVLLILDYWPLGRFAEAGVTWRRIWPNGWPLLREKLPFFALAAGAGVIAVYSQKSLGALASAEAYPLGIRLSNVPMAYALYLYKMIWPAGLAVFYPYNSHGAPVAPLLGALALLCGVTGLSARYAKAYPYVVTGWLWYLVTLAPVIGLVQVGGQSMADRYTYVPYTGVFIIAAWGLADVTGRRIGARIAVSAVCVAAVVACGYRTWVELSYWKDSETLWRRALAVTTDNFPAEVNLGTLESEKGHVELASEHFAAALRIVPTDPTALNNYGLTLMQLGRPAEAAQQFELALRRAPGDAKLHIALAVALDKLGRRAEAREHLAEAHRVDPEMDVKSMLRQALRTFDRGK